jgi:hypothetical protein
MPSSTEYGTYYHLCKVRVLPFTHRINSSSLPDKTPHGWILMPDVSKLYLGNLSQSEMLSGVLKIPEKGEFPYQFAVYGRAKNIHGQLSCRRRRTDNTKALTAINKSVNLPIFLHH